MRLRSLRLLRYGRFTDKVVELPAQSPDLHIVFGPNEAGKSTALCGIGDLLFGIPGQSPYAFLHDYQSMRIGAVLENGAGALEVLRRKGNKDTLLDADGLVMPGGEGVLRPYLAGADRAFFERMFSLDYLRLQSGGRDIVEAKDDVGRMLVSAGAGISGLGHRLLAKLQEEADALWSERRAKHRKFYELHDKLKAAESELREQVLTAKKWQELKGAFDAAEKAFAQIEAEFEATSKEGSRLSRIRRVLRDVRRKQELDRLLDETRTVVALPDEAGSVVGKAESEDAETKTRVATLKEQLERAETELEGLVFDSVVVQHGGDIRALHERRIEIRRERFDLPKRKAELHAAEQKLRDFARELGWEGAATEDLVERIPTRTRASVVHALRKDLGKLEAEVEAKAKLLAESQEERGRLQSELSATGEARDVSSLAAVIRALRQGDLAGGVRLAEGNLRNAQDRVERKLASLQPRVGSVEELDGLRTPARAELAAHRDRVADCDRLASEAEREERITKEDLAKASAAYEGALRGGEVVTAEQLAESRRRRDALWQLVKRKHVDGATLGEEDAGAFAGELGDLAGAFEPAMKTADTLADRRFDRAEAAGRVAEIKRMIDAQQLRLEQLGERRAELAQQRESLEAQGKALWAGASFEPLSPGAMLEWLDARDEVLGLFDQQKQAATELESASAAAAEGKARLLAELAALGIDRDALDAEPLPLLLEKASAEQARCEREAQKKAQLADALGKAESNANRHERELAEAREQRESWGRKWADALAGLGLARDALPEAIDVQIRVIDEMRDCAAQIAELRLQRIEKIEADIAGFEKDVGALARTVAEDLADRPADDALLEIEKRLEESERVKAERSKKQADIEDLNAQIAEHEEAGRLRATSLAHLMQAAGVEGLEALKHAVERSDLRRQREEERQALLEKIRQDGDGVACETLEEECENADVDAIRARESVIEGRLKELRSRLDAAVEERTQAKSAFAAVGGDDAAARAEAARQAAIAELRDIAARYVRVKTSALLLQWAIDRYRREKQAPILKRAGELFSILTGGSFTALEVEFGEDDKPELAGVRPDGVRVRVEGMSTGSSDQLYLALRVASIEDYLERAAPMPFIADDLFVNFDDDRAAAGFRLLGHLAEKTQVLFFTHHQHLVDIARETLGASINLVSLADGDAVVPG